VSLSLIQLSFFTLAILNLALFAKAFHETKNKKNPFGLTHFLTVEGIFVWADAVIFAPFWIIASILGLIFGWTLFLLIVSLFWLVRSFGETIYWFNQQFSTLERNPPKSLMFHDIFHNDSIWFVYQIFWQCVSVFAIISSLYFARAWILTL
jgi:hypothetical protein